MIPVKTAPTRTPIIGFWNAVRMCVNCGESASGLTELLISVIPVIRTENPTIIRPMSLVRLCFAVMIIITPISAIIGEKDSGFSIRRKTLSPSIPDKLRIQAVSVVPTFEPIRTPMVWLSSMIPEFTSPTSITVNAEEDCIAIVMPIPSKRLLKRFEVIFFSTISSLLPASFSRPDDITFMPYRKNARPPRSVITEKISIISHSPLLLHSDWNAFFEMIVPQCLCRKSAA